MQSSVQSGFQPLYLQLEQMQHRRQTLEPPTAASKAEAANTERLEQHRVGSSNKKSCPYYCPGNKFGIEWSAKCVICSVERRCGAHNGLSVSDPLRHSSSCAFSNCWEVHWRPFVAAQCCWQKYTWTNVLTRTVSLSNLLVALVLQNPFLYQRRKLQWKLSLCNQWRA